MRLPQSNHLAEASYYRASSFSLRVCKKIPSLFSRLGKEVPFSFPSMPTAAPFCKCNNLNIYRSFYESLSLILQFGSYIYIQQDQSKLCEEVTPSHKAFDNPLDACVPILCTSALLILAFYYF